MRNEDFKLIKLMTAIGNLDDNDERRKYYYLNWRHLVDYNMVYVDLENGNDKTAYLNDFVELDYDFNSLFYSNKLIAMNYKTINNDYYYRTTFIMHQVCMSFDLNIVSQLKDYKDIDECQDEVLSKVIKICKDKCCAFDITPYIIENFLKKKDNHGLDDLSIKDVRAFEEMFPYKKSKYSLETVDIETRMTQLLEMYKSDWFKKMCDGLYKAIYQLEYTYLLAIIHINFKYSKLSASHKFEKFFEFCVNDIKSIHPCSCNLAKLFY